MRVVQRCSRRNKTSLGYLGVALTIELGIWRVEVVGRVARLWCAADHIGRNRSSKLKTVGSSICICPGKRNVHFLLGRHGIWSIRCKWRRCVHRSKCTQSSCSMFQLWHNWTTLRVIYDIKIPMGTPYSLWWSCCSIRNITILNHWREYRRSRARLIK